MNAHGSGRVQPSGLAFSPDENVLYLTDRSNGGYVKRIEVDTGLSNVVAGGAEASEKGKKAWHAAGTGTLDHFDPRGMHLQYPQGVAVGPDGSLLISDTENGRLALIGPKDDFEGRIRRGMKIGLAGLKTDDREMLNKGIAELSNLGRSGRRKLLSASQKAIESGSFKTSEAECPTQPFPIAQCPKEVVAMIGDHVDTAELTGGPAVARLKRFRALSAMKFLERKRWNIDRLVKEAKDRRQRELEWAERTKKLNAEAKERAEREREEKERREVERKAKEEARVEEERRRRAEREAERQRQWEQQQEAWAREQAELRAAERIKRAQEEAKERARAERERQRAETERLEAARKLALRKNHYAVLGVPKTASPREVKAARDRLARLLHPDKNKSPEAVNKMQEVNAAYEVLSDPGKRFAYDAWLRDLFRPN